jgi:hypothetical protein
MMAGELSIMWRQVDKSRQAAAGSRAGRAPGANPCAWDDLDEGLIVHCIGRTHHHKTAQGGNMSSPLDSGYTHQARLCVYPESVREDVFLSTSSPAPRLLVVIKTAKRPSLVLSRGLEATRVVRVVHRLPGCPRPQGCAGPGLSRPPASVVGCAWLPRT